MTKWTSIDHDGSIRTFDDEKDSWGWEIIFDIFNWLLGRKIKKEHQLKDTFTIETPFGNKNILKNKTQEQAERIMSCIDNYEAVNNGKKLDLRKVKVKWLNKNFSLRLLNSSEIVSA